MIMENKIKIALVFRDKDAAKNFALETSANGIVKIDSTHQFVYETPILRFVWIRPFTYHLVGSRINFVYTTEYVRNTEWFDEVIRPMLMGGTGAID